MPGVPNVFANATSNIPLLQLDQNFNTLITIGNTSVGLGNTSFTITPNSTAGIVGTTTNDSANVGSWGEYVENNVPSGSAVSLTTATPTNVVSLNLTPGDWDVCGVTVFTGSGSTVISALITGVSSNTASLPVRGSLARDDVGYPGAYTPLSGNDISMAVGPSRFTIAANVTVYLVADAIFTTSTLSAYGEIRARRIR